MLPISVCMIVKNEEQYIEECLHRLSCFDWEIIVVDTGSTDRTVDIAKVYTPKVFHFEWCNDFSAARNYSISMAKNDYILIVDCDEYLEADSDTLPLLSRLPDQIGHHQVGMVKLQNLSSDSGQEADHTSQTVIQERIARFFHKGYVHYQGSIHEQLTTIDDTPLEFISIPLTFLHVGYSTIDIRMQKAERNISMLEAAWKENENDPYLLFQLGQSYFGLNNYERAFPYFAKALTLDVNEKENYVQTLVESYGYCLLYTQQFDRALELEGIYDIFSKRADFVFLMGLIYMNNAFFDKAIAEFLKATTIAEFSVEGVNSYKAFYNIGIIYECRGYKKQAIEHYTKCGAYPPAVQRLSQCKSVE